MSNETDWPGLYDCHVQLGTNEIKDYTRDFSAELLDAAGLPAYTIEAFAITSDPDDLTIQNSVVTGGLVSCQISLPRPAVSYALWYRVELSNGNIIIPLPILVTSQERPTPAP